MTAGMRKSSRSGVQYGSGDTIFCEPLEREDRLHLANLIRDRLSDLGLTLREAEAQTGVSRGTLSNILNGKQSPSLEVLYKIMRGLELPTLLSDLELLI